MPSTDRYFSLAFLLRLAGGQAPEWAQASTNHQGLIRITRALDDLARARGTSLPLVIGPDAVPGGAIAAWLKDRFDGGDEIGVVNGSDSEGVAQAVGIPRASIRTKVAGWEHDDHPEVTTEERRLGIDTRFTAVLEGDSLIGETIDLGNNWEGRPFFPYWAQINPDDPANTSVANRELRRTDAPLELMWLTRTPWSDYDRFCFQYSFHTGDVSVGGGKPRCTPEDIWFWRNELDNWEANLEQGNIPYAHIAACNEGHLMLEDDKFHLLLALVSRLLDGGWKCMTGAQFHDWHASRWPSPETPPQVVVFNDTARDSSGHYEVPPWHVPAQPTVDQGRILNAETKFFRVLDHTQRLSPVLEIASALEAPNLFLHGYAGHGGNNGAAGQFSQSTADGTGSIDGPDQLPVTATTGNALFWGEDPHRGVVTKWDHFAGRMGLEPRAKWRGLGFAVDGREIQFPDQAPAPDFAEIFDVRRTEEYVSWAKRVNAGGGAITLRHTLIGEAHIIDVELSGALVTARTLSAIARPFFYPAWLIPQDHLVWAGPSETNSFEWQPDNAAERHMSWSGSDLRVADEWAAVSVWHTHPDHPEMARAVTLFGPGGCTAEALDEAGGSQYVTLRMDVPVQGGPVRFVLVYDKEAGRHARNYFAREYPGLAARILSGH